MTDEEAREPCNTITFFADIQQLFEVHQDSPDNVRVSHVESGLACGGVVLVDVMVQNLVQIFQTSAFGMLESFGEPRLAFV